MTNNIKTVILCGGKGTRIRDLNNDLPKPMISVGGFPILWHIMKYFAHFNFDNFILCLGYKGQSIKDFFLNYEANTRDFSIKLGLDNPIIFHNNHQEFGWQITLADTGVETMTGGRISRIKKYIGKDDYFLLTYGDGLSDIDISKLVKFHLSHGKILTVSGVRPPARFGEIAHNDEGLVTEFNEKPQATSGRISGGYFVCSNKIFEYLNDDCNLVFETIPIKSLVKDGQMMMYPHDGFWHPMDTYRDFVYLSELVECNKAPWIKWKV
jgi:glucose-1-phosphate cytidylyltransferase